MVKCPHCKDYVDRTEFKVSKRCLNCGASLATDMKVVNYFINLEDKEKVQQEYDAILGKYGKTSSSKTKENNEDSEQLSNDGNKTQEEKTEEPPVMSESSSTETTTSTTASQQATTPAPRLTLDDFFDDEYGEASNEPVVVTERVATSHENTSMNISEGVPQTISQTHPAEAEEAVPQIADMFNSEAEIIPESKEPELDIQPKNIPDAVATITEPTPKAHEAEQKHILSREDFKSAFLKVSEDDVCIICANVSGVKQIHTDYGKKYADNIVNEFSRILVSVFKDNAYHMGSDDFIVLLPSTGRKIAEANINKVIALCEEATRNNEYNIPCQANFGFVIGTGDMTKEELLRAAREVLIANKSKPPKEESKGTILSAAIKNKFTKPAPALSQPAEKKAVNKDENVTNNNVILDASLPEKEDMKNMSPAERLRAKMNAKETVPAKEVSDEKLEVPELNYDFNKDGYYDDTEPDEPNTPDRIRTQTVLKIVGTFIGLFAITAFFIWYA